MNKIENIGFYQPSNNTINYTYNDCVNIFNKNFIKLNDFIKYINKYIVSVIDTPVNYISINMFTGTSDIYCTFRNRYLNSNNEIVFETIGSVRISIINKEYGIYNIKRKNISDNLIKKIEISNNEYIYNRFKYICRKNKISLAKNANNTIPVKYFDKFEYVEDINFTGSIFEIFSKYTTANDSLKYINGTYYQFYTNIRELYSLYTTYMYKGNYFLNNALERGVLID